MGFGFIVGSDTSDGSDDEDSDEVVEVVESEQTGDATYNGPYVTKEGESVPIFFILIFIFSAFWREFL